MNSKLFISIMFLWVVLSFLGATFEQATTAGGDWMGNVEGQSTINYLLDVNNMTQKYEVLGIETPIPIPDGDYFATWFRIFMLRFSFIVDDYEMVWWIVLMPIAILGVLQLATLAYGVLTGNVTWS